MSSEIGEKKQRNAIYSIALCADSMPGRGSKDLKTIHFACAQKSGRRNTAKRIALRAGSMTGSGLKRMQSSITDLGLHKKASRCDTQSIVRKSV